MLRNEKAAREFTSSHEQTEANPAQPLERLENAGERHLRRAPAGNFPELRPLRAFYRNRMRLHTALNCRGWRVCVSHVGSILLASFSLVFD